MDKRLTRLSISLLLIITMFTSSFTLVFSEPAAAPESTDTEKTELPKTVDNLQGQAAVLFDLNSGTIFFEKNKDERLFPASLTKIMTSILVIESGRLDKVLTVSDTALSDITSSSSKIDLVVGEQMTKSDLLYALLLASANDAGNVVAEDIAGSVPEFVALMNKKAQELGMKSTSYVNSHGLHNDAHYTTAADLSILVTYAMKNDLFRALVNTAYFVIPATNVGGERKLYSTNQLISSRITPTHIYKGALGVKTGFTTPAGYCLAGAAKRKGMELGAISLKCPSIKGVNQAYSDVITLLNHGFDNFETADIVKAGEIVTETPIKNAKEKDYLPIVAEDAIIAAMPKGYDPLKIVKILSLTPDIKAPVKKDTRLGDITYSYDGKTLGTVSVMASQDIEEVFFLTILDKVTTTVKKPIFYISALCVLALIIVVFIIRAIVNSRKKRRYRNEKVNKFKRRGANR